MSTIGSRIRDRRNELGLSADDLAFSLGKNRATIYRYEGDEIENFPISVIGPLAQVLNVSPAYLMGWSTEKETSDPFSDTFRAHLIEEVESIDADAFSGVAEAEDDYQMLWALAESSKPLSLREACEVADKVGHTVSYMLGEIDEEEESRLQKTKESPDADEYAPRDDTEREIIRRLKDMDKGQQGLLLATLLIADERSSKKPAFAQGSADGKDK